jgi:putative ABC transport system permease protein
VYNPLPLIWRHAARRKLRWVLGVLGLAISVALLTVANVGLDTFAGSYLDVLTLGAGQSDAQVTVDVNERDVPWFDGSELADRLGALPQVEAAAPRVQWPARVDKVGAEGPSEGTVGQGHRWAWRSGVTLMGMDLGSEAEGSGVFGAFLGEDAAGELAEQDVSELAPGECLVSDSLARRLKLEPGDAVRVRLEGGERELTVRAIVQQRGVFLAGDFRAWIVVRREVASDLMREVVNAGLKLLATAPGFVLRTDRARELLRALYLHFGEDVGYDPAALAREGTTLLEFHREHGAALLQAWAARKQEIDFTTNVVVSFAGRSQLYDAQDITGTVRRLREAGEAVQTELGSEYRVFLPKAMALVAFESQTALLRGIFWLVGLLSLSISALLIDSLISVNVEERVRESAILRTLGAYRRHIFSLVVLETLLMTTLALVVGIGAGLLLFQGVLFGFNSYLLSEGWTLTLNPVLDPTTLGATATAGIVVGLFAGIRPARRATEPTIVEALRPARLVTGGEGRSTERGLDLRLTLVGAALFGLGLSVYYTITLVAIQRDPGLLAWGTTTLLVMMLAGFVLAAIGAQPLLEKGLMVLLRPFLTTTALFASRNLARYRRRNTSTALIFALSISLVMFLASVSTTVSTLAETAIYYRHGSDIKIWAEGEDPATFTQELEAIEGVVAASRASYSRDFGEVLDDVETDVELSDLIGLRHVHVELYGTDGRLLDALDPERVAMAEGERDEAFARVAASRPDDPQGELILCQAISSRLDVHEGQRVRVSVQIGERRQSRVFRVAGVVRRLPGIPEFRIHPTFARRAGVLVSQPDFDRILFADVEAFGDEAIKNWRSEAYVKLDGKPKQVSRRIRDHFAENPDVRIRAKSMQESLQQLSTYRVISEAGLTLTLLFASIVAVFALIASMYATVLERRQEIAVLRALGMRNALIYRMFAGEAVTLLLASGFVGASAGFVLAYLLVSVQELATEVATPFALPALPTLGLIVLCVGVGVLAAWLPLKEVVRRPIAELLGRAP